MCARQCLKIDFKESADEPLSLSVWNEWASRHLTLQCNIQQLHEMQAVYMPVVVGMLGDQTCSGNPKMAVEDQPLFLPSALEENIWMEGCVVGLASIKVALCKA